MENESQKLDAKDLKILALRDEVNRLLDQYTDLRVEVTLLGNALSEAQAALAESESGSEPVVSEDED